LDSVDIREIKNLLNDYRVRAFAAQVKAYYHREALKGEYVDFTEEA